ncbi:MAG: hypothetical protein JWO03_2655 [Bacteroidetes bacterium]|nr:hypothetical protein [Bacteroidota bacterium]
MRPLRYIPRYTVSDYRLWEGDWELIDGLPCSMSPSPVKRHQRLGAIILRHISNSIEANTLKCGDCEVVYELDWIIDDNTVVRPDIAVICDKSGDFITSPPILIVEILSPATALKDRQVKFDIYQEQKVKYYIIADPKALTYNTYILTGGQYIETQSSSFSIHDGCTISLDVAKALADLGD